MDNAGNNAPPKASALKAQLCNTLETDMDERLEAVSEKIRMGIPVSMMEAIEAIDYQQKLKADRDAARAKTLFERFMRWIRGA